MRNELVDFLNKEHPLIIFLGSNIVGTDRLGKFYSGRIKKVKGGRNDNLV